MFIDNGSDPNETGRNTDQIISELEEEDRKIAKSVPPSPSPSPDLKKDNEKPSTTTSSTTTTTTKTSPSETNVKKEDNEKANELQ